MTGNANARAILGILGFAALFVLVVLWLSWAGMHNRDTVPQDVLIDRQAPGVRYSDADGPSDGTGEWTTKEVASAEFDLIERNLGIPRAPFTLRIRYMWKHQGMLECREVKGDLVCTMTLLPVYTSRAAAAATGGHELSHLYAGSLLGDWSEGTAWTLAACYGSGEARTWIGEVVKVKPTPADCENLKAKLTTGASK